MYTYSQYRTSILQAEQPLKLQQTLRLRSNATPHKNQLTEMGSKGKWGWGGVGSDILEAWTAPERKISAEIRDGTSDCQGVEAPWTFVSAQKDAKNSYKPPEGIKRWGSTRAGEEGEQIKGGEKTRDQRLETRISSGPAGNGLQVKTDRGG